VTARRGRCSPLMTLGDEAMSLREREISAHSDGSRSIHAHLFVLLLACLNLTACASLTLDIVRDDQLVASDEAPGVDLARQGMLLRATPGMALQAGDELRTDARSTAVVSFFSGARAYVQPNSQVRLGSLLVYLGEVLVKARGYFRVDTKYATAASEGTEYLVRVDPGDRLQVIVAEDRVSLSSPSQAWPTKSLGVGQTAHLNGPDLLEVGRAAPGEVEAIRNRMRSLDQVVPSHAGIGTALLVGAAITAGAVAIGSQEHNERDSDRRRRTPDRPATDQLSPQDPLGPARRR